MIISIGSNWNLRYALPSFFIHCLTLYNACHRRVKKGLVTVMPTKAVRFTDKEDKAIKEFLKKNPNFDFSIIARMAILKCIEKPDINLIPIKFVDKNNTSKEDSMMDKTEVIDNMNVINMPGVDVSSNIGNIPTPKSNKIILQAEKLNNLSRYE
ncbi:MAG: hypothetical protein H6621_00325 [Halobacteriovoraceae bacterium]|nr:hypothetical protein [Halobacteriovoraceae bacterium]MCB9093484.1 hypothetical protein [Halobacteriovoraceae bacterium]